MEANVPALVESCLESLESLDADCVARNFSPQAQLRVDGAPPVTGKSAVRRVFVHLFSKISALSFHLVSCWFGAGVAVLETDLTIVRDDDTVFAVPATLVLWMRGGTIERCRISTIPGPQWVA